MTDRQLIDAVEAGDYEKAHHLLSSLRINIDSSPRGKEGWIPLCLAVQIGNLELVKLLIEKGANLDMKYFLLFWPFFQKSFSLKRINFPKGGWNSLCIALRNKNLALVNFLLEKGANPFSPSMDGMTALHLATEEGDLELFKKCCEKAEITSLDLKERIQGNTCLHLASRGENSDITQLLVEKGASVNLQNQNGMTPFHIACKNGFLEIVSFLLRNGAIIRIGGVDGMMLACSQNHFDVISHLFENRKEDLDISPLCFASRSGKLELARHLISRGSPINGFGTLRSSQTPLFEACQHNQEEIAKLLLEKGAKNNFGNQSVLHHCCRKTYPSLTIIRLLIEKGADINEMNQDSTPLMELVRSIGYYAPVDCLNFLLESGARLHQVNSRGETCLHLAVGRAGGGWLKLVEPLCEYGADIEAKSDQGETPAEVRRVSRKVKKFFQEFLVIDGSIKPAKRVENEKLEEESEGSKKRKMREEEFVVGEAISKKPRPLAEID